LTLDGSPVITVQRIIESAGFRLVSRTRTIMWSADVYAKNERQPGVSATYARRSPPPMR
jgi:hypothetical protein